MSKIVFLQAFHFKYILRPEEQIFWTGGVIRSRDYLFIRVATGDRRIGWGEIGEVYFYPEIYAQIINHKVRSFMIGKDASAIAEIQGQLGVFLISLGYAGISRAIISGIDIALHNLRTQRPKGILKVPVYASTGFASDADEVCRECQQAVELGHRTIKIRGGFSVREDVKRLRAIRKYLGQRIGLILELSQPYAYTPYTFGQILKIARAAREYGLLWIEEPFRPEDLSAYARLKSKKLAKTACGENLYTEEQFRAFGKVVDVLQPDLTRMGGLSALKKICRFAGRLAPHQFGTSIGLAVLCRESPVLANFYLLELDLIKNPVRDFILGQVANVVEGHLQIPELRLAKSLDCFLMKFVRNTGEGAEILMTGSGQ